MNARVCNLDRPVQAFGGAGGQCVYRNDQIRLRLPDHAFDDLRRLHTCLRHNAGCQAAHQMHLRPIVSHLAILQNNVPVDKKIVDHIRSKGICRHFPVAQSHYENRLLLIRIRQNPPKLFRQNAGYLLMIILLRLRHGRRLQRNIGSHRFPKRLGSVFRLYNHPGDMHVALLIIIFVHDHSMKPGLFFSNTFSGFQRQVRPDI